MEQFAALGTVIERLYDAALDQNAWHSALQSLAAAFKADASALLYWEKPNSGPRVDCIQTHGYADTAAADYAAYYHPLDVRIPHISTLSAGGVYLDDLQLPFAAIGKSAIFNEFYRPMGLGRGAAVNLFNGEERTGLFSLHRGLGAPAFEEADRVSLQLLAPHVARVLQVRGTLARAGALAKGLEQALDHMPMPVLLLDALGAPVARNAAAEAMLGRSASPLRLVHGRVTGATSAVDTTFRASLAVAHGLASGRASAKAALPILRLARLDGSGVISVLLAPVRPGQSASHPMVVVFAAEPETHTRPDASLLAAQFGLTAAEAQVALALAGGARVEEIAEQRGVGRETVRIQLRGLFAKTGTASQGQLVGRLLRGLGALRRPQTGRG